ATLWTELDENRKLLARLYQIACLHVEFAQVFARPFVVRVEVQRLLVERKRGRVVASLAKAESHQTVDVRVLNRVGNGLEVGKRGRKILGLDLSPHGRKIGRARRGHRIDREGGGWSEHDCCWQAGKAPGYKQGGGS